MRFLRNSVDAPVMLLKKPREVEIYFVISKCRHIVGGLS